MFEKLKNIKLVNTFEPRIEFEVVGDYNNGIKVTKKYDVSLNLVSFENTNAEEILERVLEAIYQQAKLED